MLNNYLYCELDVCEIDAVSGGMCAGMLCDELMSPALHLSCLGTYSNVYKPAAIELPQRYGNPARLPVPTIYYCTACMCMSEEASSANWSTMQKVEDALPECVIIGDRLSWMIRMLGCCILQFV